jgi:hypothetical protein
MPAPACRRGHFVIGDKPKKAVSGNECALKKYLEKHALRNQGSKGG